MPAYDDSETETGHDPVIEFDRRACYRHCQWIRGLHEHRGARYSSFGSGPATSYLINNDRTR